MIKSNSISNYSIKSYSPPKENISNINYDINSSIPIQYQYNYNIGQNSYDTFQQQQMCVSPVKNNNYNYQNNLEYSPIISRNDNFSSTRYFPNNITLMNSPQHLYNLMSDFGIKQLFLYDDQFCIWCSFFKFILNLRGIIWRIRKQR